MRKDFLWFALFVVLALAVAAPSVAAAQAGPAPAQPDRMDLLAKRVSQLEARAVPPDSSGANAPHDTAASIGEGDWREMLRRIRMLEKRLRQLEASAAPSDPSGAVAQASLQAPQMPQMPPPTDAPAGSQTSAQESSQQSPPDRIGELERRVGDLESSTVLSEPETRVKRIEVYVDQNGNEYDRPVPGAKRKFTYQRERVYRRQTINEKIEEALSAEEEKNVKVGVSAAIAPQAAVQIQGDATGADGHVYQLASADLFFTARVAQYTLFFADVVGLTGPPPDLEIPGLTLLNGYTARLVRQNELNVREAWVRTELFSQRLALSAGRLDLTNYFDRNAAANDETRQFLSDALVNNPVLGLSTNGAGVALVYDPKRSVNFKIGFQQSSTEATNLSSSIFSLAEVGYIARPFSLPEGNYRVWGRMDNSTERNRTAFGVSLDQKLTDAITLFARYGSGQVVAAAEEGATRSSSVGHHFYSGGLQFQRRFVFFPGDTWGIGYAQTNLRSGAARDNLAEVYYNFQLTERLRLSPHLAYLRASRAGAGTTGYLVPGLRLQANF